MIVYNRVHVMNYEYLAASISLFVESNVTPDLSHRCNARKIVSNGENAHIHEH